ncbi:PRTRC system ThiF family protein [Deinococcus soli (ex Cha et al. 2016)]|uniref:PRTRC system ThiF family protein n=1 Tax=Deinococcus soli (ex Cha et al. 2016) TaxID=1309411 RepID=UPI001666BF61|nr:PRTRC system ThiF family protein [Deinococcus soli (ex Cha et al. 2016)]GGB70879.1 thiazole biosynthesis adenylyltransferase ThiF [Deinococcus soli (ex Cha et al. 2016)]
MPTPKKSRTNLWPVPSSLLTPAPLQVALVGVGGTGSEVMSILTQLHAALIAKGRGGLVVHAFDPDEVSEANIVRQRYHHADLGRNKAEVLVRRVNLACGLHWFSHPVKFKGNDARGRWDIVLSCVDTRAARADLHRYAFASGLRTWKLWMDFGNEKDYGQVILGTPRNLHNSLARPLPCATELHPDMIDTSLPEDDAPSCSALEALSKQSLLVNKMVATLGMQLLWEALWDGQLTFHGYYFNFKTGQTVGLPIPVKVKRAYATIPAVEPVADDPAA